MKKIILSFLLVTALSQSLVQAQESGAPLEEKDIENAQSVYEKRKLFNQRTQPTERISRVKMREDVVYKLQTALGYVSAIELPEPALKVFVGDQDLFKVGVYEKEVLIKPITDSKEARTNLTVVTQSGRLTFDISVGHPETADFILDFRTEDKDVFVENAFREEVKKKEEIIKKEFEGKEAAIEEKAKKEAESKVVEDISKASKTIDLNQHVEEGDIRLNLISLSQIGDHYFLRFAVRNISGNPFPISKTVLGIQSYESANFGLGKKQEGFEELESRLQIQNPVPASSYEYGVVQFAARKLNRKEKPVFILWDEEGKMNLRIEGFKWLS
ncbi:MAG: TrbG/VirB9 family P-type conjugative transfer protein [Candidatus Omnitrophica bacterium]|nr:TrbG/VirB9 family P-type conjugative transfer protein [Candidatus Omnitrophota bacterium]